MLFQAFRSIPDLESLASPRKAPNDPLELKAAAEAAGLGDGVLEKGYLARETKEELEVGRKLRVRGVPHFVIRTEGASEEISGAQPPESFLEVFRALAGK